MSFSVDRYLARRFDLTTQNCWHLVRDAWLELTGIDLGDRTPVQITKAALIGKFDTDVPHFRKLQGPESPSIVLMVRRGTIPHVGIFYGRRILQMQSSGPSYLPIGPATAGFNEVGYYR